MESSSSDSEVTKGSDVSSTSDDVDDVEEASLSSEESDNEDTDVSSAETLNRGHDASRGVSKSWKPTPSTSRDRPPFPSVPRKSSAPKKFVKISMSKSRKHYLMSAM